MAEQQRTFGELVGMEALVPNQPHADDLVTYADGSEGRYGDAVLDIHGEAHRTEDEAFDANVEYVNEVLDTEDKWVHDYVEHEDYGDGYAYLIGEMSDQWNSRIEDWLEWHYGDRAGWTGKADLLGRIVEHMCDNLGGRYDWEAVFYRNEYSDYSGDGCALGSFDVGEYENQVEINAHDDLRKLHELGILDDVLDDVNSDAYVRRSRRREKNEETGRYEEVGRETYMPYDRDNDHPTFYTYHSPGGIWYYVVSAENMRSMLNEAIIDLAGEMDSAE